MHRISGVFLALLLVFPTAGLISGTAGFYLRQGSLILERCSMRSYLGSTGGSDWYDVRGTLCDYTRPACRMTCNIYCQGPNQPLGGCIPCTSVTCSGQNVCTYIPKKNTGGGGCYTEERSPCAQQFSLFCPELSNTIRYCEESGLSWCDDAQLGLEVRCEPVHTR